MHIKRVLSYLNGWENLKYKKGDVLTDINWAIKSIYEHNKKVFGSFNINSPSFPLSRFFKLKSHELYLSHALFFKHWNYNEIASIPDSVISVNLALDKPRYLINPKYYVLQKNSVNVKLFSIEDLDTFEKWFFDELPEIHLSNTIDTSVAIIHEKLCIGNFNQKVDLYTHFKKKLESQKYNFSQTPFVIIDTNDLPFDNKEIIIDEIIPSQITKNKERITIIEKSIEFAPEHYQAGVGILSYFSEVLKNKQPNSDATIRIEQSDVIVRLCIDSENGEKEIIQKTLHDYFLVVSRQMPFNEFYDNQLQILELKNKLRIAYTEIENKKEILKIKDQAQSQQIRTHEEDIRYLRDQFKQLLLQTDKNSTLLSKSMTSNDRLIKSQTIQNQKLIEDLIEKSSLSKNVIDSLEFLKSKFDSDIHDVDKEKIKEAINNINQNAPEIMPKLKKMIEGAFHGVTGNTLFQYLQSIITSLA